MKRHRVAGLVLLTLAAAGCASVRLPQWVRFPGATDRPADTRRDTPRGAPVVSAPRPPAVDERTMATLYRAVRVYLVEQRDDEAYRTLTQITRVSPQYRDCPTLLRDLRTRLVRQRYQEGLRLFREERLEEAIVEWQTVLEMDPTQENARRNIDQAEQMLRTLAEHRRR